MSTSHTHQAAIDVLARRIASTHDLTEANSYAPALAALALDEPRPLDVLSGGVDSTNQGGVTDPSGSPSPAGPGVVRNKTLQCTTTFKTATASLNEDITTIGKELKSKTLSADQRAGLEKKLAALEHQLSVAIGNYVQCLRSATTAL